MPLPTLESLTEGLDRVCADVLGETIGYKAVGAPTFAPIPAFIDYRDGAQELAGARLVAQSPRGSLLKVDVPAKPNREVELTLPRRPGQLFVPTNVTSDESGTHWDFDCEEISSG